jgi:hypothetical protein
VRVQVRVRHVVGVALGLAVLAASGLVGHALAPDPVRDDLGDGCRGTVPVSAARVYLEREAIRVTSQTLDSGVVECSIEPASMESGRDESALMEVVIAPTRANASDYLTPATTSAEESVPFGHGWMGSYGAGGAVLGVGTATLLLDCAGQPGGGLMVQVAGDWDEADHELRQQKHGQLAVVAARLATQVSQEWGCDAGSSSRPLGEIPESMPLDQWVSRPVGQAEGTCAGVITADQADQLGVTEVYEMPAALAMVERCTLRSEDATYSMSAAYGPAAVLERGAPWVGDWPLRTSRDCGDAQGQAFYTAEYDGTPIDPVFDAFVAASAERHGCATEEDATEREVEPLAPEDADALEEPDPAINALPASEDTVRAILPHPDDMDDTVFTEFSGPSASGGDQAPACQDIPGLCRSLRAHGEVTFSEPGDERAQEFWVLAYDTPQQAQDALEAALDYYPNVPNGYGNGGMDYYDSDVPHYGESGETFQDLSRTGYADEDGHATLSLIRQGPFLGYSRYAGTAVSIHEYYANQPFVTAMLSGRLDQAEAGLEPTAAIQPGALN